MEKLNLSRSRPLAEFKVGLKIKVSDKMQKNYSYTLAENPGMNFESDFLPEKTPAEMLKLGVFEGKYLNDCVNEFPKEWYENSFEKLSIEKADITKNCFKIKSRLPLSEWRKREWIWPNDPDVRGWFQWYCRYYLGRRIPEIDERQIKRWKAFKRHRGQIIKNCKPHDLSCRPRQRQALLQWAYDPFI